MSRPRHEVRELRAPDGSSSVRTVGPNIEGACDRIAQTGSRRPHLPVLPARVDRAVPIEEPRSAPWPTSCPTARCAFLGISEAAAQTIGARTSFKFPISALPKPSYSLLSRDCEQDDLAGELRESTATDSVAYRPARPQGFLTAVRSSDPGSQHAEY